MHTNVSLKELLDTYSDVSKDDIEKILFNIMTSDDDTGTLAAFNQKYPELVNIENDLSMSINRAAESINIYDNYRLCRIEYIDNYSILLGYSKV